MKAVNTFIFAALALLLTTLIGCASSNSDSKNTTASVEQKLQPSTPNTTLIPDTTKSTLSAALSPYSTEGLLALNEFRSNNTALNDFLIRNRKPDYFFSGLNTEFTYQKIYLIYLESENLYLFDSKLTEPYKKYHPLPDSIKDSLKDVLVNTPSIKVNNPPPQQQTATRNNPVIDYRTDIEKSLVLKKLEPYLTPQLLHTIPSEKNGDGSDPIYADLYFLDKPLAEILENEYSIKYDSKKKILKLIFPKAYEAEALYKKSAVETRKIFVEHTINTGGSRNTPELSLVVPDFLPGSALYQVTHGNMSKVFSSLYQVKVPGDFVESHSLHMRYSIKLCQHDAVHYCAVTANGATLIRAIVIAATLYDSTTNMPIETFVLK